MAREKKLSQQYAASVTKMEQQHARQEAFEEEIKKVRGIAGATKQKDASSVSAHAAALQKVATARSGRGSAHGRYVAAMHIASLKALGDPDVAALLADAEED